MPFGCYCFNKLPFGITSAPKHFQKRIGAILEGLERDLCLMDDVLVFPKTKAKHGKRLFAVLQWIQNAGITLNIDIFGTHSQQRRHLTSSCYDSSHKEYGSSHLCF